MTRLSIVALILVVVMFTLSGCARDGEETSPRPEAPNRTTKSEAFSVATKPPDSTLILGKHTATGLLGSYCWQSASGATEAGVSSADVAGILVPAEDEALIVPRNWVLVFDYGGKGRPTSVDASAYPLDREKGSLAGPNRGAPLVRSEGRSALEAKEELRVSCLGERVQIPVKLAAGEYVVEVSVRVPEGDAAYYFRIVVV